MSNEDQQYVFEMVVTERAKAIIPVLANDAVEAKEIFDEWKEANKEKLEEMLENGYEGYEIYVGAPRYADKYPVDDILLTGKYPDEKEFVLYILDVDDNTETVKDHITLSEVGKIFVELTKKYCMEIMTPQNAFYPKFSNFMIDFYEDFSNKNKVIWGFTKKLRKKEVKKEVKLVKGDMTYYELDCDKTRVARPEDGSV